MWGRIDACVSLSEFCMLAEQLAKFLGQHDVSLEFQFPLHKCLLGIQLTSCHGSKIIVGHCQIDIRLSFK